MNVSLESARAAKAQAARTFGDLVGDVAVGIMKLGDDSFGLKVNLSQQPAEGVVLPNEVAGVPVKVEYVGEIRKR